MYIKCKCPYCEKDGYHSVSVEFEEETLTDTELKILVLENINVKDSQTEENMLETILRQMKGYIKNGISVSELYNHLKNAFGIAGTYCCDLVQRIKIELDMYCPDRQHLYFVTMA